jgi:hypothetical protein
MSDKPIVFFNPTGILYQCVLNKKKQLSVERSGYATVDRCAYFIETAYVLGFRVVIVDWLDVLSVGVRELLEDYNKQNIPVALCTHATRCFCKSNPTSLLFKGMFSLDRDLAKTSDVFVGGHTLGLAAAQTMRLDMINANAFAALDIKTHIKVLSRNSVRSKCNDI